MQTKSEGYRIFVTLCIWIGLFALLIRVAAALVTDAFHSPQVYEYDVIARNMLAGEGFVYRHLGGVMHYSLVAPLYPFLSAGVYVVTGGSVAALLGLQIIVGSFHVAFCAWMGGRLFGRTAGVLTGVMLALHPGLVIYTSQKAHPLIFDALVFSWVFWEFYCLRKKRTVSRAVRTGLAVGVAILTRPTAVLFVPAAFLCLFITWPRMEWSRFFKQCVLITVLAGALITPWSLRNAGIYSHFVFIRTNWEQFWRGNNPNATGHSYRAPWDHMITLLSAEKRSNLAALRSEHEQNSWFREQAFAFIREEPGQFVRLTLNKFKHFWWFSPLSGHDYPSLWFTGYKVYYCVILLGMIPGTVWILRSGSPDQKAALLLMVLFLLSVSGIQALHYVEGRHRWPLEPFLILLAGRGWAHLCQIGYSRVYKIPVLHKREAQHVG